MKQIAWPTVIIIALVLAALVLLAYLKVDPNYLVALGGFGTVLAGVLERVYRGPPPPPPAAVLLLALAIPLAACTPGARRDVAHGVLDVASIACLLANAESDDPTVRTVCHLEDVAQDDLHRLIGEQRAAARRYAASRAGACGAADAGGGR